MKGKGKESEGDAAKKIKALFTSPNPLQSWSRFEAQLITYYQIFGYCLVLPIVPVGFEESIDTTRFWIIPPILVDIEETKNVWYSDDGRSLIKKIILRLDNEATELNWDELIIFGDFIPSDCSMVLPASRLEAIKYPIETAIQGFTSAKNGLRNTPTRIIVTGKHVS